MQIEVFADNSLKTSEGFNQKIREVVESYFSGYESQVSRFIVHLHDENGPKVGIDDKRCLIEARVDNMPDVIATNYASDVMGAVEGACDKLSRGLESAIGKRRVRASHVEFNAEVEADYSPELNG